MALIRSAGVLLYRKSTHDVDGYELLLAHPGGPYWAGKRAHAYGVPKGEFDASVEEAERCARREFREETGQDAPSELVQLGVFDTKPHKVIHIWVAEQDFDTRTHVSNTFEMEWPKGSGRMQRYPEVDHVMWVPLAHAEESLHKNQVKIAEAMRVYLRSLQEGN